MLNFANGANFGGNFVGPDIINPTLFQTSTFGDVAIKNGQIDLKGNSIFDTAINNLFTSGNNSLINAQSAGSEDDIRQETELLMSLLAPSQERARESAQSLAFNRGQLGVGTGANNSNPTLRALEEAIGQQNLGAAQSAIASSRDNRDALFANAASTFGLMPSLASVPLEFSSQQANLFSNLTGFDLERELAEMGIRASEDSQRSNQLLQIGGGIIGGFFGGPAGAAAGSQIGGSL